MANRSKVAQQKASVREEIERRWRGLDGRVPTLDELMAWLRELGLDIASDPRHGISRSGLHRHLKHFGEVAERMHEAERVAGSVVGSLSESTGGNTRRMLTQLLTMVALHAVSEAEANKKPTEPKDVMFLAKAIRDIEGAFKTGAESEFEIRKQIAADLQKKTGSALEKLDAAAKAGGLSPDTAKVIRQAIAEIDI